MTTQATTTDQLLEQANALFQRQDLSSCEALYRQVLKAADQPRLRSAASYGLGLVALSRGADQDAAALLEQALQHDSANANAAYYLGVLSGRRGDELAARRWYATTLVANPTHQGALAVLTSMAAAWTTPKTPQRSFPPNPPVAPDSTVGIALHIRQGLVPWRGKPASMTQLTFRVEVYDRDGSGPLHTIGVELRGHEVHGVLEDGDWVELPPGLRMADSKPVKELRNLSTGQRIYSKYRMFNAQ